jgi:P27 family predicted phage terminase small subunit
MGGNDNRRPQPLPQPPGIPPDVAAIWQHLAASLSDRLRPEDGPALEVLCRSLALLNGTLASIAADGITSKLSNGVVAMHQGLKAVNELRKIVLPCLRQFGLTPDDRRGWTEIAPTEREQEDFDDFLDQHPSRARMLPSTN